MTLDLKVPPVAQLFVAGLLMYLIKGFSPDLVMALPWRTGIALLLATLGAGVALLGVFAFRHANTTVDPRYPEKSESLVVSGVYRITRNPMYLGMVLLLLAWGAYLANPLAMFVLPLFVIYMSRFQIRIEERFMQQRFGESYTTYSQRVRRWL